VAKKQDISKIKAQFELKVNGANGAFCSLLMPLSDKYVADFILEAVEKKIISDLRGWLLFEEDTDENFFKAHEGIISFEMIRQSMYEMATTINDDSYNIYENQGALLGVQEDQEAFEIRKIVEWAKLHSSI
jgi:hypothetical protein